MTPLLPERYAIERGNYALYVDNVRVLVTRAVAVLIDTRLGMIITHGDPVSVRWELDEMRRLLQATGSTRFDEDWLLLEGRPHVEGLNACLRHSGLMEDLKEAFAGEAAYSALEMTRALIARVSRCDR